MNWLQITIDVAAGQMERLTALLTAHGYEDLVIEDQAEFESFLDENRQYWDYIDEELQEKLQGLSKITLYIEADDQQSLQRLEALAEHNDFKLNIQKMAETDWSESWKENYPPQPVGDRLLVLPYWLADSDTAGRLPVILDPGLTFGTGAHPSTQMVMEQMGQLSLEGKACLDLGSGSGILSIAALRLGAKNAIGVDIDQKAEDIARENAAYNNFGDDVFTALTGNVTTDRRLMDRLKTVHWDLVLVNIVADVIIALSPVLPDFVAKDSTLLLSGILDTRLNDVLCALQKAGFKAETIVSKEEWRCIRAKRS